MVRSHYFAKLPPLWHLLNHVFGPGLPIFTGWESLRDIPGIPIKST